MFSFEVLIFGWEKQTFKFKRKEGIFEKYDTCNENIVFDNSYELFQLYFKFTKLFFCKSALKVDILGRTSTVLNFANFIWIHEIWHFQNIYIRAQK